MLKTVKQYAAEKGITTQGVRQLKKITLVQLPLFVEYEGVKQQVGSQKFVIDK